MSGAEAALPYLLGAAGGTILSQVVAPKPTAPASTPAPAVEAPKVMPLPDDMVAQQAKRRAVARRAASSSSLSTILSDGYAGSDSLG